MLRLDKGMPTSQRRRVSVVVGASRLQSAKHQHSMVESRRAQHQLLPKPRILVTLDRAILAPWSLPFATPERSEGVLVEQRPRAEIDKTDGHNLCRTYIGDTLAKEIQQRGLALYKSGKPDYCVLKELETRATVLGHIQRSSVPSSFDRLIAAAFGCKAVELIEKEQYQQLVIWSEGRVDSKPLEPMVDLIKHRHRSGLCTRPVEANGPWVKTARELGIYVGGD